MDFAQSLIGGVFTILGYVLMFVGVWKIYQIATDIREIKETIQSHKAVPPIPSSAPSIPQFNDSASAYAEQLLRAVNQESQSAAPVNEPR